jgi:hypothetical protein
MHIATPAFNKQQLTIMDDDATGGMTGRFHHSSLAHIFPFHGARTSFMNSEKEMTNETDGTGYERAEELKQVKPAADEQG